MFARSLKASVSALALAIAATIAVAHPTSAQTRRGLEVALSLGAYLPAGDLPAGPGNNSANNFGTPSQRTGCSFLKGLPPPEDPDYCLKRSLTQAGAVTVGGRVTAWLTHRSAIEGSFWYSPSGVTGSYFAGSGNVVMADLRLVLDLAPRSMALGLFLMGGPAVVHRYGESWADVWGTTSPAFSLGTGIDVALGRSASLRAQIGDYMSQLKFASGTRHTLTPWKFQHDWVVSMSLSPRGGRGKGR